MKKTNVIILVLLVFLGSYILGAYTWTKIINVIPNGFADKYKVDKPCERCEECKPFAQIINPSSVTCDRRSYRLLIDGLNDQIKDLKERNSCYETKCISWEDYKCN